MGNLRIATLSKVHRKQDIASRKTQLFRIGLGESASSPRWPSPTTSHIGLLSDVIEGSFGLLLSLEDRKVGGAK